MLHSCISTSKKLGLEHFKKQYNFWSLGIKDEIKARKMLAAFQVLITTYQEYFFPPEIHHSIPDIILFSKSAQLNINLQLPCVPYMAHLKMFHFTAFCQRKTYYCRVYLFDVSYFSSQLNFFRALSSYISLCWIQTRNNLIENIFCRIWNWMLKLKRPHVTLKLKFSN